MLSRLQRVFAAPATQYSRRLNQIRPFAAIAKTSPEYKLVPFEKEDVEQVMQEVPPFSFYQIGSADPVPNIYHLTPMDQPILTPDEIIPPQLKEPKLQFSKLENGLRIASIDKGGLTASLGLFVHAGSRHEDPSNYGVSHMIEKVAYQSTAHLSFLRQLKTVEVLGANVSTTAGRECMMYNMECLRQYMPILAPIMIGNVLFPRFLRWEMKDVIKKMPQFTLDRLEESADVQVTEMIHAAAYHNNSLGNRLYATKRTLENCDEHMLRNFMLDHYSPDRMVFVGVNVDHGELSKWLMRSFVDYNAIPHKDRKDPKPRYTGGDVRTDANVPNTHFALAFETGGWNSADLVPATILQTILGGGGSFSTGGPGKGMYTRLFTDVLNKHEFVESAIAFNTMYTDSGLFGFYLTTNPLKGPETVKIVVDQVSKLSKITAEELKRAKNSLKSSVLMNLESRNVMMEDIARQILMSDKVLGGKEFCALIDACTEEDIKRTAAKLMAQRPSIAVYGDCSTVPHYEEIVAQLAKAK